MTGTPDPGTPDPGTPDPGTPDQLADLRLRLDRLDTRSASGSFTRTTLLLIDKYPGVAGSALARNARTDARSFRTQLRSIESLGLTERSGTGYRLTGLGAALLRTLQ